MRKCVSVFLVLALLHDITISTAAFSVAWSTVYKTITPGALSAATASTSTTSLKATESTSICVVGGGVSGLTAALIAAKECKETDILLLESSDTLGGRVQSDKHENGFILDRGFAVFIEEYPFAKQLLDYNELRLKKFLPGALVKVNDSVKLERVADPLRVPGDLLTAILAPVGTFVDKLKVLPLIIHVRTNTIEELFDEPETDTLTALKTRWDFSDGMIEQFFQPFLEGIYLAPLNEQSSRMFHFVFKMFSEGAATLPEAGIGTISNQLIQKAINAGVNIRTGLAVTEIAENGNGFVLTSSNGEHIIQAKSVILATDGVVSKHLLSKIKSLAILNQQEDQPQRSVGCLYYAFKGEAPVKDPILILNGNSMDRGTKSNPVNNVCFPSVVSTSYAPEGFSLCSVTVLKSAMEEFKGEDDEFDLAVRKQLTNWFPNQASEILNDWSLLRIYKIPNAQPAQLHGPAPANVNQGRPSDTYRGLPLPKGLFVCGDHVATATLNGALASGVQAGNDAATFLQSL